MEAIRTIMQNALDSERFISVPGVNTENGDMIYTVQPTDGNPYGVFNEGFEPGDVFRGSLSEDGTTVTSVTTVN